MKLIFEWDRKKAVMNLRKHKVSFEEARTVFQDLHSVTFADDAHSGDEDRFITIGTSEKRQLLLVVHTENHFVKGSVIIRIISCRKATKNERRTYEEEN